MNETIYPEELRHQTDADMQIVEQMRVVQCRVAQGVEAAGMRDYTVTLTVKALSTGKIEGHILSRAAIDDVAWLLPGSPVFIGNDELPTAIVVSVFGDVATVRIPKPLEFSPAISLSVYAEERDMNVLRVKKITKVRLIPFADTWGEGGTSE